MTELSTRRVILDHARRLFAERGFTGTTIRDIADAAGVSPALVMKLTRSKAELFRAAAPDAPEVDGHTADELPGYRLVRSIVGRRDAGEDEYWAAVPFLVQEATDRDAARTDLQDVILTRLSAAIGDDSVDKVPTRLVSALLLGLAGSLRAVELLPPEAIDSDQLIETYGALVQSVIDEGGHPAAHRSGQPRVYTVHSDEHHAPGRRRE